MAINFLNTVSYNQNQLKQPVIDNQLNDTDAGTPVDGQLYYDTTLNVLKVGEGSAWVTIAGSVTSVDETTPGTSTGVPIVVDPTTGAVLIKSMAFDGDSNVGHVPSSNGETQDTNFLRADGTWAVPTGSVDTTYDFLANQSSAGSDDNPFLTLDPSTGADDNVKLTGGNLINITRVSSSEISVATTADNYNKWVLRDSADSDSDITTGKFVKLTAATGTAGVTVSGSGSTSDPYVMAIQLPNDNTQYTAGNGLTLTGTVFSANVNNTQSGENTQGLSTTTGRYYAVQLDNDSAVGDAKLVVNVPWTDNNSQNTYALDKAANSTDLTLAKNGSVQDTITFSGTGDEVEVTGVAEDAYIFGLPNTVKITTQLEVLGSGVDSIKTAGKAQSASTAGTDASTTLVTKDYVDGLVAGGLTFKGTFRADTGEILSGDNDGSYLYQLSGSDFNPAAARVAVALGDYYVVANTGGNFYGSGGTGTCATTSFLDVGDAVIGVEVASANASVCSDWSLISQGVVVNSFKADSANSSYLTMSPTTATTGAVELDADLSAADGSSATSTTRFLSKDNEWAIPTYTSAYSLPTATTSVLGGVKLFSDTDVTESGVNGISTTTSRWYGIQLTENDKMVVNIPWTDTQNANQTISGVGTNNTDSGIELSASGGTVLVLGAGSVTASQTGNTITLTGTNTTYTAGDGLTLSGTEFAVDYLGTDNIIETATDLEGTAIALTDTIMYSDADDNNVKKGLVSDLPFSAAGAFSAANVVLNTSTSGVSQQSGPPAGTEGWVIDTNSVLGATAINTKCEVITSGGETVYADVTRSGNDLTINFVGSSISQGTYQALIIKVA